MIVKSAYCTWIDWHWPIEKRFDEIIADHFSIAKKANPKLWNGRVLMSCRHVIIGNVFHATFFTCNYSTFLAWRDGVIKDDNERRMVRNTSAIGVIFSKDYGMLLGKMAESTASPGLITCPGGIPDESDLIDDDGQDRVVDLDASIVREMTEETGLDFTKYVEVNPNWMVIEDIIKRQVILAKSVYTDRTKEELMKMTSISLNQEFDEFYVTLDEPIYAPNYVRQAFLGLRR